LLMHNIMSYAYIIFEMRVKQKIIRRIILPEFRAFAMVHKKYAPDILDKYLHHGVDVIFKTIQIYYLHTTFQIDRSDATSLPKQHIAKYRTKTLILRIVVVLQFIRFSRHCILVQKIIEVYAVYQ